MLRFQLRFFRNYCLQYEFFLDVFDIKLSSYINKHTHNIVMYINIILTKILLYNGTIFF